MTPAQAFYCMDACDDAVVWAESQTGSAYDLWRRCERGDWLLWLADEAGVDRKLVTLAACACAREVLAHVPDGEDRPRIAIETAEAWTRGKVTIAEAKRASRRAGRAAEAAVIAPYAADAAYAACDAAFINRRAAYAPDYASDAPGAVKPLLTAARHVRRIIPWSAVRDALGKNKP